MGRVNKKNKENLNRQIPKNDNIDQTSSSDEKWKLRNEENHKLQYIWIYQNLEHRDSEKNSGEILLHMGK